MPDGKEEVHAADVKRFVQSCHLYVRTGLSSDYESLARLNSIYYPLLFCLLNFGIGMFYVATK